MKCSMFFLLFFLTASLFPQQVPKIPYQSVPDFLKLPKDIYFGEVAGVAVNSKGHVFVFSRGDSTGPAYGAGNFWSSVPTANSFARSVIICMPGRSRTQ